MQEGIHCVTVMFEALVLTSGNRGVNALWHNQFSAGHHQELLRPRQPTAHVSGLAGSVSGEITCTTRLRAWGQGGLVFSLRVS